MTTIFETISSLGFEHHFDVVEHKSITEHFQSIEKCGIYILHFGNGELYVGQAIDVTRRYTQHSKIYDDIIKISFKCILPDKLNTIEKKTIEVLEGLNLHLRNIVHTSVSYAPSSFDELITPDDQLNWCNSGDYIDKAEERINNLEIRRKYQTRYKQFLKMPRANEVIEILRHYVTTCIPAYKSGEMYYWSCTCLLEKRPDNMLIYSRININWQEVFTVGTQNNRLFFSWHLANSPIRLTWKNCHFYRRSVHENLLLNNASLTNHRYSPGGQNQINMDVEGNIDKALSIMRDPHILYAMKYFNLNLMRKGPSPYFKYHCFDLADNFFI
ncbi:MAG: hypothetical protein LCI00_28915 [Chloroflexi bacterium]|nr:hypothetical protein [Chloroflexota bacterium]MCC6891914.1 hypothetical protein [Anaerolineae bacterium]